MKDKIIHIDKTDNYKIVVISDIHGHVDHLKALLGKIALKDEDYLIILGDFLNKGPKIIETFDFVMSLKRRAHTYVLKGNHESFMERPIRENDNVTELLDYIKTEPFQTIWREWAKEDDFNIMTCHEGDELRNYLLESRKEELEALRSLPIILKMDDFLFVHGGYEEHLSIKESETDFLKFDFYNELASVQKQHVVVGHFPACILREDKLSNVPYFNDEKHIISIDGGLGVKLTGELNALIIEKNDGRLDFSYQQIDHFETVKIVKEHTFDEEAPLLVKWPHREIELLQQGKILSKCIHLKSKKTFTVLNEFIETIDGKHQLVMDYVNQFFNLKVGDEVKLVKVYDSFAMVKHQDLFGWVHRDQLHLS